MRCDRHGRPDPNGEFDLKDGKVVLRDGTRLSVDITSFDSATPRTGLYLTDGRYMTDAERTFASSDAGRLAVTKARSDHARRNAYLGDAALPFTDQMAATAARRAMTTVTVVTNSPRAVPAPERLHADKARRDWSARRSLPYADARTAR